MPYDLNEYVIESDIPDGLTLEQEGDLLYFQNDKGERFWPDDSLIHQNLKHQSNAANFVVKYIGQAYGKEGSRNAIDRLLKHETLQKISLKGIPDVYNFSIHDLI